MRIFAINNVVVVVADATWVVYDISGFSQTFYSLHTNNNNFEMKILLLKNIREYCQQIVESEFTGTCTVLSSRM